MTGIDPKFKEAYDRYIKRFRKFEFIDWAIITQLGSIYLYSDNEVPLYTNSPLKPFATDYLYIAKDKKALLLIEETEDPSEKKDQLIKYANLSAECTKLITKTDVKPSVDVMLVIPEGTRSEALKVYDEVEKEVGDLRGKGRGISIWRYDKSLRTLRICGGTLSPAFPKGVKVLHSKSIGTFKILKNADPVSLLLFIIMKALEAEYGISQEGIEITKEKLEKWLSPFGILKEERWAVSLKIGQDLGILSNLSSQQLTGTLNYTKPHPSSIGRLRAIMADPFNIRYDDDVEDTEQKSLFEFDQTPEDKLLNSEEE